MPTKVGSVRTTSITGWARALASAVLVYSATGALITVWSAAGDCVFPHANTWWQQRRVPSTWAGNIIDGLRGVDGRWYEGIAIQGYTYRPECFPYPGKCPACVFFPAYPLAGRWLARILGVSEITALLIASHVSLCVFLAVLWRYCQAAFGQDRAIADYAIVAFALFPTSIFCRMAYTESLFLMLCALVLLLIRRNEPGTIALAAFVAGVATATRPTGVALAAAVVLKALRPCPIRAGAAWRLAWVLPLSFWGVGMYVTYLALVHGDWLAFAQAQRYFSPRPDPPLMEKLLALASGEPVWATYMPASPCYWRSQAMDPPAAILSLQWANPLYYIGAVALLGLGAWKRWCTAEELVFGFGILLIPYATRSYEACMVHGRYAMVAVPQYLVLANVLARAPRGGAWCLLTVFALLLGGYSAMAAAGYPFL